MKKLSIIATIICLLLTLSGCAGKKDISYYPLPTYQPQIDINYAQLTSVIYLTGTDRFFEDSVIGAIRSGLRSYFNKYIPSWKIRISHTKDMDYINLYDDTENIVIDIEVEKNGQTAFNGSNASIRIFDRGRQALTFNKNMASQQTFRTLSEPVNLQREATNLGVLLGQEILNRLAEDETILAKAIAEKKKIGEEEKLERERSNPENSLKRAVAIFEKFEKDAPGDTIINSIKAYRQAGDEGYNPKQLPEICKDAIVVRGNSNYKVLFNLDPELSLETVYMNSREAKVFVEQDKSESVVAVQVGQSTLKRSVRNQSKVQSRYIYDYLIEPNPEYHVAQLDYQRALTNYNREVAENAVSSVTYSNGWAAALAGGLRGFSEGTARQVVEKARNRLAQISPTRKVPQEKTYEYDKMTVMVEKHTPYSVYLIKGQEVQEWKSSFTDNKTFTIAYNKKDDDTSPSYSSYDLESDVEKYERADVTIGGADVADLLFTKSKSLHSDQSMAYLNPPTKKKQEVVSKKKAAQNKVAGLMNSVVAIQDNGKETIGTGFFVKKNIILTNRHVIDGNKLITIHTRAGKELLGKVISVHHDLDLALVKVASSGIPVRFYGSEVAPGDEVLAIGNPMGLEFSLTKGVISSVRLRKDETRPFAQQHLYIQTDVAINPGNSGGPLFLNGKVVGINTLKLVAKNIEGIGFAIHYNEILEYLKETEHPVTPNAEVASIEKKPKKNRKTKQGGVIEKMVDLKYLYDHQLITTKEYQQKKTKLLDAM